MWQDGSVDVILGKALCVLPETELLKPVSDLLHRLSAYLSRYRITAGATHQPKTVRSCGASTRVSISLRSVTKSIGLVSSASLSAVHRLKFA